MHGKFSGLKSSKRDDWMRSFQRNAIQRLLRWIFTQLIFIESFLHGEKQKWLIKTWRLLTCNFIVNVEGLKCTIFTLHRSLSYERQVKLFMSLCLHFNDIIKPLNATVKCKIISADDLKWLIAERRQNSTQKMFLFTEQFILWFDQHQKLNSCIVEHKLEDISDFSLIHCRIWACACCQVLGMADTTMSKLESAHIDHCTDREAHKLHKDCNLFVELECKELTCCVEASSWMVAWVFTEDVDR